MHFNFSKTSKILFGRYGLRGSSNGINDLSSRRFSSTFNNMVNNSNTSSTEGDDDSSSAGFTSR